MRKQSQLPEQCGLHHKVQVSRLKMYVYIHTIWPLVMGSNLLAAFQLNPVSKPNWKHTSVDPLKTTSTDSNFLSNDLTKERWFLKRIRASAVEDYYAALLEWAWRGNRISWKKSYSSATSSTTNLKWDSLGLSRGLGVRGRRLTLWTVTWPLNNKLSSIIHFSPYRAVNALLLGYKNQPFNVV